MQSFPKPLSAKEEAEYLEQLKHGNKEARNILIERNLRLVAHIVKKYNTVDKETDDLISIGTIGLIKAVDSFNPDKGIRLATYASRCIDNAILSERNVLTANSLVWDFGASGMLKAIRWRTYAPIKKQIAWLTVRFVFYCAFYEVLTRFFIDLV